SIMFLFFFSSRRRHTRFSRDWSSDVCSSDLLRKPDIPVDSEQTLLCRYLLVDMWIKLRKLHDYPLNKLSDIFQCSLIFRLVLLRSEERRVGKECRFRSSQYNQEKNTRQLIWK